jgi:hypothetical protein
VPAQKSASISKTVKVGKFAGVGFLNVTTSRGDVKMFHGDHLVTVDYSRAPRPGEPGFGVEKAAPIVKSTTFVVPEDAAKALGIFLKETVEEEIARLEAERAAKTAETKT